MISNAIIVNGKRVVLPAWAVESGFTASNYLDDGEPRFVFRKRRKPLVHFILHETCGNTASGCKSTLIRKGYGVHLIMSERGHLSCHGDLATEFTIHANQCNGSGVGMEVVSPYTRLYAREPFGQYIAPQWWTWTPSTKIAGVSEQLKRLGLKEVPRGYVLPTERQLEFVTWFVPWVCNGLGIPVEFPTLGLNKKTPRIAGWDKGAVPGRGIVAHRDFSTHASGRYLLERVAEGVSK